MLPGRPARKGGAALSLKLELQLLGGFRLLADDKPVSLAASARGQALLAYLALHQGVEHPRSHLAYLFWPDATEAQARNNLRQALFQLRRAWPAAQQFVKADAQVVGWHPGVQLTVDAVELELAIASADQLVRGDEADLRLALRRAIDLYQGDLLPGTYDEWLEPERERLRSAFGAALTRLLRLVEAAREYPAAIALAERRLALDPFDEDACAALMRLHALNDDRAAALRAYRECEARLQRELGAAPGPELREAFERLAHARRVGDSGIAWATAWPLVGRKAEWAQLQAAWRLAAAGQARLVLISGEAGIGKTRLAEELLQWASLQGVACARTRAYAAEGRLAYGPLAEWLRSPSLAAGRAALPAAWLTEVARLLPELVTERPDLAPPAPLTDFSQRQRFFQTLARVVLSASQPLVLVFDDLQWCDSETLEWLHFLLRFDPAARLLVIGTVRAEDTLPSHPVNQFRLAMLAAGTLTALSLRPLNVEETHRLAGLTLGRPLDGQAAQRLYADTEGNPLFVVETVRANLGPPAPPGEGMPQGQAGAGLPPRVHGVIVARLSQLSTSAAELAGLAATIGRAFRLEVLAQAAGVHEDDLARGLEELWQRRIIREQAAGLYDFSHDKLREVAYLEVSPPMRRLLHRRVAQALEAVHRADHSPVSGQIAAHYEQAGLAAQAIPFYHQAALSAQHVFANDEAIRQLHRALGLLRDLPQTELRASTELQLQQALAAALVAGRGYDTREVLDVLQRTVALGEQLGQPPSAPTLRALAIASIGRGHIVQAHRYGNQLRALAERNQDPVLLVEADYVHGVTSFWQGRFLAARSLLASAIARYQPRLAQDHLSLYSQDPRSICLSRQAFNLWCLGELVAAQTTCQEALTRAHELGHPLTLGYACFWAALLHLQRRHVSAASEAAQAVIDLDRRLGVPYWVPFATVLRGAALVRAGKSVAGWDDMESGLNLLRAAERELLQPYLLALQAELRSQQGEPETGLRLVTTALEQAERKSEHWCIADLRRIEGECLWRIGDRRRAEEALVAGLHLARSQEARSFQLRAALSLARIWRDQRRLTEARSLLEPLLAEFGPELATPDPDLVDAADLLTHL